MGEPGVLHVIEDDLSGGWVAELAETTVEAVEEYLAKHLAFLGFLDDDAATQRR